MLSKVEPMTMYCSSSSQARVELQHSPAFHPRPLCLPPVARRRAGAGARADAHDVERWQHASSTSKMCMASGSSPAGSRTTEVAMEEPQVGESHGPARGMREMVSQCGLTSSGVEMVRMGAHQLALGTGDSRKRNGERKVECKVHP